MTRIHVSQRLNATPEHVWSLIDDIESHRAWMSDAVGIRITSSQRQGVGTTFEVPTKVGPLKLTDRMEITEWEPGLAMGVRHVGVVTGSGRFTLVRAGANCTDFAWTENLRFPWWLGGPVGGWAGRRILEAAWRRNLTALRELVDAAPG